MMMMTTLPPYPLITLDNDNNNNNNININNTNNNKTTKENKKTHFEKAHANYYVRTHIS